MFRLFRSAANRFRSWVRGATLRSWPEFRNLFLAPGDRIIVPFAERFINVVGEVRSSAPVAYSPGMTVNYYIGMAGGFLQTARRNSIRLVSPDGESVEAELTTIVPQGTTVEVPRVAVYFWQEYLTILTGVATVVSLTRVCFNRGSYEKYGRTVFCTQS